MSWRNKWTVDSGQLNIESTHTSKQCLPAKSLAAQWPVNGDRETDGQRGERQHVPVYYHKLWLHVSCDSRGRRIQSVCCFLFLPAQTLFLRSGLQWLTMTSLQSCCNTASASWVNPVTFTICMSNYTDRNDTGLYCSAFVTGCLCHSTRMLLKRLKISARHQPTLVHKSCQMHSLITFLHLRGCAFWICTVGMARCALSGFIEWDYHVSVMPCV